MYSDVEEDRGLVGELLFFNTHNGSVHLVVDVGQVGGGGSLTDTTELVVHRSVTKANPSLVGSEIGNGDATEMSANGRAAQNGGVTGIGDGGHGLLIELSGGGEGVGLVNLRLGKTTDKDHLSVPGGLEDFTRGELRNIEFLVGISDVPVTGNHLMVDDSEDSLDTENVGGDNESLEHVSLGSLDFVVTVLFVPEST